MLGSHGQNQIGGGTVSNCLLFIPGLVRDSDESLWGCLESQYIELCEETLSLQDGCCGNRGN